MTRAAKKPTTRKARLVVCNEYGLHIRAAAMLVKLAEAFDAQLTIECGKQRVNGKSIMSLVALGAAQGMAVLAIAEGTEADRMIRAVAELFGNRFYENPEPGSEIPADRTRCNSFPAPSMDRIIIQKILNRVENPAGPPATATDPS